MALRQPKRHTQVIHKENKKKSKRPPLEGVLCERCVRRVPRGMWLSAMWRQRRADRNDETNANKQKQLHDVDVVTSSSKSQN
jgi:hypothetical protein